MTPRTGSHLKVIAMGDAVLGVRLEGDRGKPEPIHFRLVFPGGDVEVVRTTDGDNWVHVHVDRPDDGGDPERAVFGELVDARLDVRGKHASDVDAGDFADPGLYHVAVRVKASKSR